MKNYSFIMILILFVSVLVNCSDSTSSDTNEFSGITNTDKIGVILNDDDDDWQPRINESYITKDLLTILPAFPNPCTTHCHIEFNLSDSCQLKCVIKSSPNEIVKELIANRKFSTGKYRIRWDGKNDNKEYVSDGIYRVYFTAINSNGKKYTTFGDIEMVTPYGSVTDIDGNTYKAIKIGNQYWLAENLKVTKYRNGGTISDYWAYDNDDSNVDTYGRLYSWYAVNDSRNIAPVGWHVPSDAEWEELAQYISDDNGGYSKDGNYWYDVGTHLKSVNNNANGTDDYGFVALLAGYRSSYYNAYLDNMDHEAYFWSVTEYSSDHAWARGLDCDHSGFSRHSGSKGDGLSVRLLKD